MGLFGRKDAIEQLSIDLEILNHKLMAMDERFHHKFETLDEYDSSNRAKFRALADHLGIEFRTYYNPNKYEVQVTDLSDRDVEEITTNNQ